MLARAGRIRGKLLLVHSMMDDNVHPQHTMQLLTALGNASVDADVRIYPPGRHGAAYNLRTMVLLQQTADAWLNRWLRGTEAH